MNETVERFTLNDDLLKNVTLLFDDEIIGGCVEFDSSSITETKGIKEYLNSEPYAIIGTKKEYTITIRVVNNHKDYSGRIFDLSLNGKGFLITYSNCQVLTDREYTQDGILYRVLTIGSGERRSCCE